MPSRRIGPFALCVALASLSACQDARVETYPVSGVVRFEDGQPVPFGVIEFRAGPTLPVARGNIGPDGRFTLGTFTAGDGAVAGRHTIIVVQHAIFENAVNDPDHALEHRSHKTSLVDPAHASYETSGLTADVKQDADNRQVVEVRRFAIDGSRPRQER
jgi:hypothetical protein